MVACLRKDALRSRERHSAWQQVIAIEPVPDFCDIPTLPQARKVLVKNDLHTGPDLRPPYQDMRPLPEVAAGPEKL